MSEPLAIKTFGLTKSFGAVRALRGLELEVEAGEIYGFLGPNGAGKTTTIRLLLDLIRPTAGRAEVFGHDTHHASLAVRSMVGYLPGELALYGNYTGRRLLKLFSSLRPGGIDRDYADYVVSELAWDTSRRIKHLSRGNKQKAGLILSLVTRPRLLILDEPTSGLDPLVQQTVYRLLHEARDAGTTVFFSSHFLPEVERICDRVGIIRDGELVQVGSVSELKSLRVHRWRVRLADEVAPQVFDLPGVTVVERNGRTWELEIAGQEQVPVLVKRLASAMVMDIETEAASLETMFLHYYRDDEPDGASPSALEEAR